MYVIVRYVGQFKYYWNVDKQQWEGLINNATKYTKEEAIGKVYSFLHNRGIGCSYQLVNNKK